MVEVKKRASWQRSTLALLGAAALLAGCAAGAARPPGAGVAANGGDEYGKIVSSPVRTDADREMDARRRPLEFLRFARPEPGMRTLDIDAGAGYTAELLALAVGDAGVVYAQTEKPRPAMAARLAAHPQRNIVPALAPFADPVPPQAADLDLITLVLNYHDIANLPVDRVAMDRHLFDALKPGGHLVIIDHAAKDGSGVAETRRLHRIDEAVVKEEVARAGFRLEASGGFLRNPDDDRTAPSYTKGLDTDRFALRFVKP